LFCFVARLKRENGTYLFEAVEIRVCGTVSKLYNGHFFALIPVEKAVVMVGEEEGGGLARQDQGDSFSRCLRWWKRGGGRTMKITKQDFQNACLKYNTIEI
jgi:hypothetical protein